MNLFATTLAAAVSIVAPIQAIQKELPKEIIAEGQWIIADMDGTLIGAPGYKKEPTLDESVAKEAIFNWLRAGGHLLVTTGGETQRTYERFARFLPEDLKNALTEKRLLLATNGGAVVSYFNGSDWIEDSEYQNTALSSKIGLSKDDEQLILNNAVATINDFYRKLRDDPSFIPDKLKPKYEAIQKIASSRSSDFTLEELDTLNSDTVPRIEVRRAKETQEVMQICIIGIPSELTYDESMLDLDNFQNLEKCRVGVTIEINIKGVNKALPVLWLEKGQPSYPNLLREKSVAVGDRPNHNDAPLTSVVGAFVSVCENDNSSYIPSHITRKIGHNELGTKELLQFLLLKANEFDKSGRFDPVIPNGLDEAIEKSKDKLRN